MSTDSDPITGIYSRAGLEQETSTLRLASILGFSLIVLVVLIVVVFFGFDGAVERLFGLSLPHLLLAPLALYASVRFGYVLVAVLVFAVLQVILDGGQWIARALAFSLTINQLVFIVLNTLLLFFAVLYAGLAYRLWIITRKSRRADTSLPVLTPEETYKMALQQESNTIRMTAL
jgi:hypothetical protein